MKIIKLSHSRLRTWRECTMLHYYKYVLKLEPKERKSKLDIGSCVHDMLAAVANGQDPLVIFEGYIPLFEEMEKDYPFDRIPEIVERYVTTWKHDPLEYEKVEEDLSPVVLFESEDLKINLVGKIDGLVVDKHGKRWILERKTSQNSPDDKDRFFTSQAMVYLHLLREHGLEVNGVLWDYVRVKPPAIPERLKSGELTRRANIDTTVDVFTQEIIKHKLDAQDYKVELERLEGKELTFYRRHRQPIVESALETIVEQATRDARRMAKQQDKPTMNLHHGCKLCSFQSICQATLTDSDPEFIIDNYFRQR
jgi:ATP-dependent helicase/DNAse subunit B